MDLNQYRLVHSELVEHYQFIEFHLEGIYAAFRGEGFCDGLRQVEKHSIRKLMQEIRDLEKTRSRSVLTEAQWQELEQVNQRRNFWCHECYIDMVFDRHTGGPKYERDVRKLLDDRACASRIRDQLFEKKIILMHGTSPQP